MDSNFENSEFLQEIQDLHMQMDACIERHGMQEHVVSIIMTGVIDVSEDGEDILKAIYSYNIHDDAVLEESFLFMRETYYKNILNSAINKLKAADSEESVDDLLSDLGIDVEPGDDE